MGKDNNTISNQEAVAVGRKALRALNREANAQRVFISGLFRIITKHIAEKYGEKNTLPFIDPPNFRVSPGKVNGRTTKYFNSKFSNKKPKQMLRRLYEKRRREYEKTNPDAKYMYQFSHFMREEILEYMNAKGYNLTIEDLTPEPETKPATA